MTAIRFRVNETPRAVEDVPRAPEIGSYCWFRNLGGSAVYVSRSLISPALLGLSEIAKIANLKIKGIIRLTPLFLKLSENQEGQNTILVMRTAQLSLHHIVETAEGVLDDIP